MQNNVDWSGLSEMRAWTVAVGNLPIFPTKRTKKTMELIKSQDGFIGVVPFYPRGTLILFETENDAKGARNVYRFYGIKCGDNICEVEYESDNPSAMGDSGSDKSNSERDW